MPRSNKESRTKKDSIVSAFSSPSSCGSAYSTSHEIDSDDNVSTGIIYTEKESSEETFKILVRLKKIISSSKTTNSYNKSVLNLISELEGHVMRGGMPSEVIDAYVTWLLNQELDMRLVRLILHLLVPRYQLSELILLRVISSLAHPGPVSNTKLLLLKWVTALLQLEFIVSSTTLLRRTCSILFQYLAYDQVRYPVAHLLYLLTRPYHVQPYRIRSLMRLQTRFPTDNSIAGLLAFYKQICPSRVILSCRGRPAHVFPIIIPPWQRLVRKLWISWNGEPSGIMNYRHGLQLYTTEKRGLRRRKALNLTLPQGGVPDTGKLALYHLPTWSEVLSAIDLIALPQRGAAVLGDRHLQLFLMSHPESDHFGLKNWLLHALKDATLWTDRTSSSDRSFKELLKELTRYVRRLGRLPPGLDLFLGHYLLTWDGIAFQSQILELITYFPRLKFADLWERLIQPLLRLYGTTSPLFSSRIIHAFTRLLRRWISNVPHEEMEHIFLSIIDPLSTHLSNFATLSLSLGNDAIILQHRILTWVDLLSSLFPAYGLSIVSMPSPELVNRLLLHPFGASTLNRVCRSFVQYRLSLSSLVEKTKYSDDQIEIPYLEDSIQVLNHVITDICNALWKLCAFDAGERPLIPLGLPPEIFEAVNLVCAENSGFGINELLSLFTSPSLIIHAHKFFCKQYPNKEITQPVTPSYLTQLEDIPPNSQSISHAFSLSKALFLEHLALAGYPGIRELLSKSLNLPVIPQKRKLLV